MNNKNTTESKQKQEKKGQDYNLSDCKPSGRICRNPIHELPKQLTTTEQAIFNNVVCTTTNNAHCYKRQDTIAKEVGCCVKTVGRTYKVLQALGLINYKKQGYKTTCLVRTSSWFYDFTIRNKLSKLFPALKYLPVFALVSLNTAKASIPENVPQDILRECLFKNYIYSRRYTPEFKNLRSITSKLLKPSKNNIAAPIFKKTLKRKEENGNNTAIPVLFIQKSSRQAFCSIGSLLSSFIPYKEELQREVEAAKSPLTMMQNNSKLSDSKATGPLIALKKELELFRKNNRSSWTMDKINLYMDFRAAIQEIEKSLPPFDDEKIMVMRKRLDSCIKKDTGIKDTGRVIQQDYKCLAAGDDTHRR